MFNGQIFDTYFVIIKIEAVIFAKEKISFVTYFHEYPDFFPAKYTLSLTHKHTSEKT